MFYRNCQKLLTKTHILSKLLFIFFSTNLLAALFIYGCFILLVTLLFLTKIIYLILYFTPTLFLPYISLSITLITYFTHYQLSTFNNTQNFPQPFNWISLIFSQTNWIEFRCYTSQPLFNVSTSRTPNIYDPRLSLKTSSQPISIFLFKP